MYYQRTNEPSGGGQAPMQDYMKFQNVSPEMINLGLNAGQDMLNKQKEKYLPGLFGFWISLKYYFAVSNSYVVKKLTLLLYPIRNTHWTRTLADEFERGESDQVSRKWALPKQDVNAPDLYIPLMSFITYVLLYGLSRGMGGGATKFSPDLIINSVWRCLILQILEAVIIKFSANFLSVSVPFLDIFALTGYKYVALSLNTFSRLLNGYLNMVVSLYTSSMIAYFVLKSLATLVPPSQAENNSSRIFILLGFGAFQMLLIFFLSFM